MLNKSLTNILQRNEINVSTDIRSGQTARYEIINSTVQCTDSGGGLINQQIASNIQIVDKVTAESAAEIKNLLKQAANTNSEQFQKIVQELGGGLGMVTTQQQDLSTTATNIIETAITQESLTNMARSVSLTQDGNVRISGSTYEGPCALSQDLVLSLQASSIINSVMATIANNETITDIVTKSTQRQEVEMKGLADVVRSIGDAVSKVISSTMLPLIVAGALVVLLTLIGGAFGGKPETRNTEGKVLSKGSSGFKVAVIVLLVMVLVVGAVFGVLFALGKWPIRYPSDVVAKKCTSQYDKMVPVTKEMEKATTDEQRNQVVVNNQDTIREYQKCMGYT